MKNYQQFLKICLPVLFATAAIHFSRGQDEIQIQKQIDVLGQTKPIPVALEGFSGEVADVLKFDLYVQGFSFVAPDAAQYQISGTPRAAFKAGLWIVSPRARFFRAATPARHCGGRRTRSPTTSCRPSPAKKASRRPKSPSRPKPARATAKFTWPILTAHNRAIRHARRHHRCRARVGAGPAGDLLHIV